MRVLRVALMSAAIFGNVSSIMLRVYQGTEDYREMLTSIREFIRFNSGPVMQATPFLQDQDQRPRD